jgi:putative ABC transport system permease protein
MTKLFVLLSISIQSLTGHKLRSFLTMLGVVIGVGAVISLVAVGQGAQAQVVSQFEALGSNLLTVQARQTVSFARGGIRQSARTLKDTDVEAIKSMATTVALVAPEYSSNATVVYGGKTTNASVTGVTAEYAAVRNWTVIEGRFITEEDQTNVATVVVVGQKVISDLLSVSGVNPIGEVLRINRQSYQIVGVLKPKGDSGVTNQDNIIFMPLRTAQMKLGGAGTQTVRAISLQVRSKDEMELAQAQVTAILRSLHGIATGGTDDFQIQNQADLMTTVAATTGTFTALLGSIAAISLLVGGIGIMNIMLVGVAERTREIGLRKAVGAKRRDILFQFLTEAIVLSVLGGIIGVAAGIGGAQLITPLLGGSKTLVTSQSIVLALSVSLGIGVFFGLYPANRAASLSPIDALRYE